MLGLGHGGYHWAARVRVKVAVNARVVVRARVKVAVKARVAVRAWSRRLPLPCQG